MGSCVLPMLSVRWWHSQDSFLEGCQDPPSLQQVVQTATSLTKPFWLLQSSRASPPPPFCPVPSPLLLPFTTSLESEAHLILTQLAWFPVLPMGPSSPHHER